MSRSEILAKFEQFGILPTPQRLEVAEILLHRPQHLSADQIIAKLHELGSTVSKATVYNSLNLFGKCGLIKECLVDPASAIKDNPKKSREQDSPFSRPTLLDAQTGITLAAA